MNSASVGFQCPKCISSGRATSRAPRTKFGAVLQPGGGTATKLVMGVLAAVYVLDLVSRGSLLGLLVMSNQAMYAGQFWRLLTYGFTSIGLLGLLMNLLVLWLVGRAMESELGSWRFLALYVASGLGGATLFFVFGPFGLGSVGASAAIVGLLGANAIGKSKGKEDIRGDISLLVLLVLYSVLVGFSSFGWIGLIGGIAVGSLVGAILAYAPREHRSAIQVFGLVAVVGVCLAVVVVRIAAF